MIAAIPMLSSLALTLTNPTIDAIVDNGLSSDEDQFAEDLPVPPLESRVVVTPITDGTERGDRPESSAFYVYEDGELTLTVSILDDSDLVERRYPDPITYWREVVVFSRLDNVGKAVGTNAYGTKVPMELLERYTIKAAFDFSKERRDYLHPSFTFSLPPKEARALATAAMLEITLASPDALSGKSDCDYLRRSATLDSPYQLDYLDCVVQAEVETIRLIDGRNGEVLGVAFQAEDSPSVDGGVDRPPEESGGLW